MIISEIEKFKLKISILKESITYRVIFEGYNAEKEGSLIYFILY